ncbi:MAG: radical SAM protein [Fibrobacter sp.]|nr:radical SAM protein [Fibrobacter sp.]
MLTVCEIFKSIQGESTYAGCVCTFVRLTGCNLDCSYCDTRYAFIEGTPMSVDTIMDSVDAHGVNLVELTGGEPLIQAASVKLCEALLQKGYTVLVETNGSLPIRLLPSGCVRIVDVKCPGSGCGDSFLLDNIDHLNTSDEVKFVISDNADFNWACNFINKYQLHTKTTILFSPCIGRIKPAELASWIVESNLPVRLGLQLHKFIWGDKRGV